MLLNIFFLNSFLNPLLAMELFLINKENIFKTHFKVRVNNERGKKKSKMTDINLHL